jgi:hypothetical protein
VSSFAVDGTIAGACIDPATPLDYHVETNSPTTITISGYRVLSFDAAGTYDGTLLPEPASALGLLSGAVLLAALRRRRMYART